MDVHRARNVQLRGWSGLDEPAVAARFEDVVLGHAEEGRARLGRVRIDGSLAAFSVGLVSGGTLGMYANMVSPEYLHFSAGTVLNADTVRHAHATGLEVVDWGLGEQRYKLSGAVELQRLYSLTAWSSDSVRATLATRGLLRARTSQVRWRLGSLVPPKSDIQQ